MHQPVAELEKAKLQQVAAEIIHQRGGEKLQQPVGEFPSPFAYVPWGHHIAIISKCKSVDERQQIIPTNQWAGDDREKTERQTIRK